MKHLAALLILAGLATAQLPDSPSHYHPYKLRGPEEEPVSMATIARDQDKTFWNANTRAGNITFWTLAIAGVGATFYDAHQTMAGTASGVCTEHTLGGPGSRPSAGKVYGQMIAWDGAAIGMGYLFKRLRLPIAPYSPLAVPIIKHLRGGMAWNSTGCL